jgi:hypothetical protein
MCLTPRGAIFKQPLKATFQNTAISLDSLPVWKQIGAHDNVPGDIGPHLDVEMDLVPILANSGRTTST